MDDSRGNLVPVTTRVAKAVSDARAASVFRVGEILSVKQSEFRIVRLGKQYMKLKLLPATAEEILDDTTGMTEDERAWIG